MVLIAIGGSALVNSALAQTSPCHSNCNLYLRCHVQIDLNDPNSIDSLDVIAEFDHKGEVDWQLSEEASVELPGKC